MKNTVFNFGASTILRIENNSQVIKDFIYLDYYFSCMLYLISNCTVTISINQTYWGRTLLRIKVSVHFVTEGEETVEAQCDQCLWGRGASYHPENWRVIWAMMDNLWLPGSNWSSSPGPEQTKLYRKLPRWVLNLSKTRDLKISQPFLLHYTHRETFGFFSNN